MSLPRPSIPLKVQRDAALIQLGLDPKTAELDHDPALGLRARTPDGGYKPAANDPEHLKWRDPVPHAIKTFGTKATTAGSDIHLIAKGKRLRRDRAEHQAVMAGEPIARPRRKAKIAGRPFSKQHRPLRSRNNLSGAIPRQTEGEKR